MGEILSTDRRSVGATRADGPASWRAVMRGAVRSARELCQRLQLPETLFTAAAGGERDFPVFVTEPFLRRIRPGDSRDPLLLQVLPAAAETETPPGFSADPVGEAGFQPLPGVIQKYARRVLLVTSGACAVHCRYCFRRHFPYAGLPRSVEDWRPALEAIRADRSIDEVILSGGDPLTLVDPLLESLVDALEAIPHVRRVRVHTRLPIMIPSRVTARLVDKLRGSRLAAWMVIHANHPQELDAETFAALGRLIDAGIPVLNQAVLLRGVNDSLEALETLCRRLVDHRVTPYYLHQLDRVAGASHFEVPVAQGRELITQLRARLPGYAVPAYVEERPGEPNKTPLGG